MMPYYLIMAVSGIHLSCLWTHLIIFRPVLLYPDSMEVTSTFLVSRAEEVGASIDMVVHMECIDGERGFANHIYEMREVLSEAIDDVLDKRARRVVGDKEGNAVKYTRRYSLHDSIVGVGKSMCSIKD